MGNRKHNLNQLPLPIGYYRMIFPTAELAAVVSPLQDLLSNLFPVFWIAALILRSYRHDSFSFQQFLYLLRHCLCLLAGAETVADLKKMLVHREIFPFVPMGLHHFVKEIVVFILFWLPLPIHELLLLRVPFLAVFVQDLVEVLNFRRSSKVRAAFAAEIPSRTKSVLCNPEIGPC